MLSSGRTSTRNSPEYDDKSKANVEIDFTQNSDAYFALLTKLQKNAAKVRQKDSDQEKTLMEYLPVNEKFNLNKEGKVLTRWQERQRDWDRIQTSLSKKLGSKSARPLMMTTTDEYRAKIEEYDLIQAALPLKDRYSDNSWQMTLRGGGPICIAIGHIFSGIECKVDVNVPKPKMIRKPKPAAATFKNDTFLEQTDSLTMKRKKYEKSILEIRPHTLNYRDASNLVVRSSNLFTWAKESSAQFFKDQEEDLLLTSFKEEEDDNASAVSASEHKSVHSLSAAERGEADLHNVHSPRIDFLTSREVVFSTVVNKDSRRSVAFRNTGSVAVSYRWKRVNMEKSDKDKQQRGGDSADVLRRTQTLAGIIASKGIDNGLLRANVIAQQRDCFFCLMDRGDILPDEVVSTVFSFSSRAGPGLFRSTWVLEFTPFDTAISVAAAVSGDDVDQKLVGAAGITLRAHCVELDESVTSRGNVVKFMTARATETMARDIIQNCIRRVRVPVRLADLQSRQNVYFREVNDGLLTSLGDTRYPTLLPLFVTPQRLDTFADIFRRGAALFSEVTELLLELQRDVASKDASFVSFFSADEIQSNPFVVTDAVAQSIRQRLFPEALIEIFDEVDDAQITPSWDYDLENARTALTALLDTVQQVQTLEERIAARNWLELKVKLREDKRAARKLAANGNDSDEEEEEEEEEEDDDAEVPVKPPHVLRVRTETLLSDIQGGLNVLVCRPVDSQMLVDTARVAVTQMTERFNDWRSAALTDAGLLDLVTGGASIPPLPSPFTSKEGADAWAHALKQTSAIAEPVAPVKGAPKPLKNAPPPTGPTAQQTDYFYRQMYNNVREGLLDMAEALFGEVNGALVEAVTITDSQTTAVQCIQSSLFDVSVVRAEDVTGGDKDKVAFVSLDGDAFTAAKAVSSAFDVARVNKLSAVQPICKLIEFGAKAIVILYEPSSADCGDIASHFAEMQELVNKQREEFIAARNKELTKLKRAPPAHKSVKYMSCKSFAELNHRLDALLRYGEFPAPPAKGTDFFASTIPVILLQGFSFPGVVPDEPPFVEEESDDEEGPISVGLELNAARLRANWIARRPHRVSVDIDVGSGSRLTVQCYADATASIKEAVSLATNQGDEVLWVDGAARRVFVPNSVTALKNLTPSVSDRFVAESVRDSLIWTGVLQVLPSFTELVSTSSDLSSHLRRVFPVSALKTTKPNAVAVLGGNIRSDKFRVFDQFIETMDTIFIVGELALPFIAMSDSVVLKKHSTKCAEYKALCTQLVQKARLRGCKLVWPCDVVHGDEPVKSGDRLKCFERVEPDARNEGAEYEGDLKTSVLSRADSNGGGTDDFTLATQAQAGERSPPTVVEGFVCDIGPETCRLLKETLAAADLVFVWGTAGVCELSSFQAGQQALVESASVKVSEEAPVVVDPSTLSKDPLVSVLLGDSCNEWFCRFVDSDGELGGNLVAAGAVSFTDRSSALISGVLGRCASHLLAKSDGAVRLRPCAFEEWVYSNRVFVVEEEEEDEEEDD